jgi:hypothetical protein
MSLGAFASFRNVNTILHPQVVASATGPRGTTHAMLDELADGSYRLFDRCAEGKTPDGTGYDVIYSDSLQARFDAVRLVDIWVQ